MTKYKDATDLIVFGILIVIMIILLILFVFSTGWRVRTLDACLTKAKLTQVYVSGDVVQIGPDAYRAILHDLDGEQYGMLFFDSSGSCQVERK